MGATLIPPGVPVTPAERQQAVMEQRRRATEASLHRVRRLGLVGSDRMMEAAGIASLARFGELTVEQRAALAALLRMRSGRVSRVDAR